MENRALTIDAIIVRNTNILLIKRKADPFKGYWALPGGHIDWDEEVADTVKKEVLEETGLHMTSLKLQNVYSNPKRDPKQKITLAYIVETEGEPMAGSDAEKLQWFDVKDLPEEIAFDHK